MSHFKPLFLNITSILQVIEHGMFVKHCKVEVYLLELNLCENNNMDIAVTRYFSKADTIGEQPRVYTQTRLNIVQCCKIELSASPQIQ